MHKAKRGAVAVEFALAFPTLVLVLMGGLHFTRVYITRHMLAEATAYAARALATTRNTGGPGLDVVAVIRDHMGDEFRSCLIFKADAKHEVDALFPANPAYGELHGKAVRVETECQLAEFYGFKSLSLRVKSEYPY